MANSGAPNHRAPNHAVWFDIPVLKLDRAMAFYSKVLNVEIKKEGNEMPLAVFAHSDNMVSGCLHETSEDSPSDHGPLVYLNANGRLDEALSSVEKNGGKILKAKHAIGPYGWRAIVLDSEGNRVALHSEK